MNRNRSGNEPVAVAGPALDSFPLQFVARPARSLVAPVLVSHT